MGYDLPAFKHTHVQPTNDSIESFICNRPVDYATRSAGVGYPGGVHGEGAIEVVKIILLRRGLADMRRRVGGQGGLCVSRNKRCVGSQDSQRACNVRLDKS